MHRAALAARVRSAGRHWIWTLEQELSTYTLLEPRAFRLHSGLQLFSKPRRNS